MQYNFTKFKENSKSVENWLQKEFGGIRTARATPAIFDNVLVEAYGSKMPLHQVATINIEDAKTIRVAPYDQSQIKAIEKGISSANLGLSVMSDEKGVRVSFPDLTAERRTVLLKTARDSLEKARVSIRQHRDEIIRDTEDKFKKKELSEDEKFRAKTELQKLVEETNKRLDDFYGKKEKEIQS
jgi:ribosome recycling factor